MNPTPVPLSYEDRLLLVEILDTAVGQILASARDIDDDVVGASESDPEWAAVLSRQGARERDRAARFASLRDRIGADGRRS